MEIERVLEDDRMVDRRHHVARVAGTGRIEHLVANQMRLRGHTLIGVVRRIAVPSDQPRHVRAVSVVVVWRHTGAVLREVVEGRTIRFWRSMSLDGSIPESMMATPTSSPFQSPPPSSSPPPVFSPSVARRTCPVGALEGPCPLAVHHRVDRQAGDRTDLG